MGKISLQILDIISNRMSRSCAYFDTQPSRHVRSLSLWHGADSVQQNLYRDLVKQMFCRELGRDLDKGSLKEMLQKGLRKKPSTEIFCRIL